MLRLSAARLAGIALMGHVGRADHQKAPFQPRNHENDPLLFVLQRIGVGLRGLRHRQHDVAAAHQPQRSRRRRGAGQAVDTRDPRTCRVDDEARFDAPRLPALVERYAITIGERRDGGDGAAIEDIGAAGAGIEEDGERQPRVVGQAVAIMQNRRQSLLAEPRELGDVIVIEPAACRQAITEGERVVKRKAGPEHQSLPALPAIDRQQEFERRDEMRRGLEQLRALEQKLAHERELEALQIAQATMNQLRGGRRRGRSIIALLGEHDFQPAAGGVARDRGAVNAAADDQDVECLLRHQSLPGWGGIIVDDPDPRSGTLS